MLIIDPVPSPASKGDRLASEYGQPIPTPPEGNRPVLQGLQWRKRQVRDGSGALEDQYVVMTDRKLFASIGLSVLGVGYSPQVAALAAERAEAFHRRTPESFLPALAGCTFGRDRSAPGTIPVYTCLDAQGNEIGRGEGRMLAATAAYQRILSAIPAGTMTFKEFNAVCVTARVRAGHGAETLVVYDASTFASAPSAIDEGTATRALLRRMYDQAPAERLENEHREAFVARMQGQLLETRDFDGGVLHVTLEAQNEPVPLTFHVVMHAARVRPEDAVRMAHDAVVEEHTLSQRDQPAVRERRVG